MNKRITLLDKNGDTLYINVDVNPFEIDTKAIMDRHPLATTMTFEVKIDNCWCEVASVFLGVLKS